MKNMMTVKELIAELSKHDGDKIVSVSGGGGACGSWAALQIGIMKEYSFVDWDDEHSDSEDWEPEVEIYKDFFVEETIMDFED